MEFNHIPVLLEEVIQCLKIDKNGIYIDGTMGGAGHSKQIIKRLSEKGMLIGIDKDKEALAVAEQRMKKYKNVKYIHGNHDEIKQILNILKIDKVNGILLDLGVSSYQIDEKQRGFSYMLDSNLDMRMDITQSLTAKHVINTYKEEKLANIIYEYGEEKFSRQIARKICEHREKKQIETTLELVEIIKQAIPYVSKQTGHPAKKTFQAIRIEVNNEIEPLYKTVLECIELLKPQGRLCIITFHSLEDRAVKRAYKDAVGSCTCPKELPYCICNVKKLGEIITKKPIIPTQKEKEENSRSRSAKLRIFEKI